jgi:DNA-binding MarR family transcriptional regulator
MNTPKLIESIFQLLHALKSELSEELSKNGVQIAPMHIKILKVLSVKAPCTAQCLADFLGRDKGQVARLIQDLLAADQIERLPNPNDKRSQLLHLKDAAKDTLNKMNAIENKLTSRMAENVSEDDQALFISLANTFTTNLRAKDNL